MDAALLDTCVLLKSYLCDTLLSIAEEGAFRPQWSDHILAELRRNPMKAGAKQEAVEHRLGQMTAYFPDARVTGYEDLISSMTNHPKDRHVLAAAVAGRADMLVTENLKDFTPESVVPLGITVAGQDDFLLDCLSCTRTRCLTRFAARHPATGVSRGMSLRCWASWQDRARALPAILV